jgi:hypothetical protein
MELAAGSRLLAAFKEHARSKAWALLKLAEAKGAGQIYGWLQAARSYGGNWVTV